MWGAALGLITRAATMARPLITSAGPKIASLLSKCGANPSAVWGACRSVGKWLVNPADKWYVSLLKSFGVSKVVEGTTGSSTLGMLASLPVALPRAGMAMSKAWMKGLVPG